MNITAKELSGEHIGKTVTLTLEQETYTAPLAEVVHGSETETIVGAGNHVWRKIIYPRIAITIGSATFQDVPADTLITIQEEK